MEQYYVLLGEWILTYDQIMMDKQDIFCSNVDVSFKFFFPSLVIPRGIELA